MQKLKRIFTRRRILHLTAKYGLIEKIIYTKWQNPTLGHKQNGIKHLKVLHTSIILCNDICKFDLVKKFFFYGLQNTAFSDKIRPCWEIRPSWEIFFWPMTKFDHVKKFTACFPSQKNPYTQIILGGDEGCHGPSEFEIKTILVDMS